MIQTVRSILAVLLAFLLGTSGSLPAAASPEVPAETYSDPDAYLTYRISLAPGDVPVPFAYENDPAENEKAMADAVVNPDAVFGFSPNPESVRLKEYVDAIDWTDPVQVAAARAERLKYHESMSELYRMIEQMLAVTEPVEEIARAVSQRRNELRLEAYRDDPDSLARVKQSNLDTYGNEFGPTPDSLYEKYGSWQMVLEKALGSNAGMDACLGFYDEYFELYDIAGP